MAAAAGNPLETSAGFDAAATVAVVSVKSREHRRARVGKPNQDRAYVGYLADCTEFAADVDISAAVAAASAELSESLKHADPGSTMTAGFIKDGVLYVAHIGDSALGHIRATAAGPVFESVHVWHVGRHDHPELPGIALNVGRALGDASFLESCAEFSTVDSTVVPIQHDVKFMVGFSDGLAAALDTSEDRESTDMAITKLLQKRLAGKDLSAANIAEVMRDFSIEKRSELRAETDDTTVAVTAVRDGALVIVADGHGFESLKGGDVAAAVITNFPTLLGTHLGRKFTLACETGTALAEAIEQQRLADFPLFEDGPLQAITSEDEARKEAAAAWVAAHTVTAQSANFPELVATGSAPFAAAAGALVPAAAAGAYAGTFVPESSAPTPGRDD